MGRPAPVKGKSSGDQDVLTRQLVERGLWIETGVRGVYGRDARFEAIVEGFDSIIVDLANRDGAERLFFPPVMSREVLVRSDYLASFPELCGSIHCFNGNEQAHEHLLHDAVHGRSWTPHLQDTELVMTPAGCYPVYPTLSGQLPTGGRLINLSTYVLRREPSSDPARLQVFRQRENVRVGSAEEVESWRSVWMDRGVGLLEGLELPVRLCVASDPFFGRGGRLLKSNQQNDKRKFEIVMPITSETAPTALASFNYHATKLGAAFAIRNEDGSDAHTACFGFGLERIALALLKTHGFDPDSWPEVVRSKLGW